MLKFHNNETGLLDVTIEGTKDGIVVDSFDEDGNLVDGIYLSLKETIQLRDYLSNIIWEQMKDD